MRKDEEVKSLMRDSREQDPEIDLRACLGVLIKRKKIVLSTFFTLVFIAAAVSLALPNIHEISMIIGPPISGTTDAGVVIDFDTIANMRAQIDAGAFNAEIISDLNLDSKKELEFTTNLLRGGASLAELKDVKAMSVRLKQTADKVDVGKKILSTLVDKLNRDYEKFTGDRRRKIKNKIASIQSQTSSQVNLIEARLSNQLRTLDIKIDTKVNGIKFENEKFKLLVERERQFVGEIKEAKENSVKLIAKREGVLGRNSDGVVALLFATTIQQNIAYSIQMQGELSALKADKENILNAIEDLKNSINETVIEKGNLESTSRIDIDNLKSTSRINIEKLNMQEDDTRAVQVIQAPRASPRPVWPKKRQNVLIAAVVGAIMGVSAALMIEWWESCPA